MAALRLPIVSLLVLVVSAMAQVGQYGPPKSDGYKPPIYPPIPPYGGKGGYDNKRPYGPDINEAVQIAETFINQFYLAASSNLSEFRTIVAITAKNFFNIDVRELPAIRLDNAQIDADIARADEEITDLLKRVSDAEVSATAAIASANATRNAIIGQRALLNQIVKKNVEDDRSIAGFQQEIKEFEAYFLGELEKALEELKALLAKEQKNVATISSFVDNRKCEVGTIAFTSQVRTVRVLFNSVFTNVPVVDAIVRSRSTDVDDPLTPRTGTSGYKVVISDVTTKGFTAQWLEPKTVALQTILVRFLACQNFEKELQLY